MKAFITKYALSEGIQEVDGQVSSTTPSMLVVQEETSGFGSTSFYHRDAWWRTRSAALIKAREMRVAKIKSLKKQIKKLEAVKFE